MEELRRSLKRSSDTAVRPDKIHYQFLKHLPESSLRVLLRAFNKIWQTGQIPSSWQEATIIIPIPKPGKDHSNPTNYRPIALTSCICKTMERMVNDRVVWTLERECLISEYQCGFRRGRSTLDHLVRFETFLRKAFIRKQHAITVFFDLEKVYDMTWWYGIMRDLYDLGIRGRLPIFIASYTDGSKDTERVSVAAVLINHSYGHRIQDHGSIFTAEVRAVLLALGCIKHSNRKRFLIFTDSMSCLQAFDHLKIDHPIIEQIISKLTSLKASGFDVHLCWLPGHVGIRGNERAVRAGQPVAIVLSRWFACSYCDPLFHNRW